MSSIRHLIDAKVLKQDLMLYGLAVFADMDLVTNAVKIVNRQPDVDAVPTDWIAKYVQKSDDDVNSVICEMMREYYDERNS